MNNVGFYGGSEFRGLGPASDMRTFFGCVQLAVSQLPAGGDGGLLTDRLYRRYLRLDELEPANFMVLRVQNILKEISPSTINWAALGCNKSTTRFEFSSETVADVVQRYLESALDLIGNARGFEKRFQIYKPVITIITDTPRFYIESNRPLENYDALEGEPMWLR